MPTPPFNANGMSALAKLSLHWRAGMSISCVTELQICLLTRSEKINKREENETKLLLWRIFPLLCALWWAPWWPQSRLNSILPPSLDPRNSPHHPAYLLPKKKVPSLTRLRQSIQRRWSLSRGDCHNSDPPCDQRGWRDLPRVSCRWGMFAPRGWITSALSLASSLKLTWLKPILGRYS